MNNAPNPVDTEPDAQTPRPPSEEATLRLDLPILLPDLPHEQDPCIDRLLADVQTLPGVHDAHVIQDEDAPADDAPTGTLCLHYDPHLVSLSEIQDATERAGARVTERYQHETLDIRGMECTDCPASIEHILARQEGVHEITVNYAAERMRIEYDAHTTDLDTITDLIERMGYRVHDPHAPLHEHAIAPIVWPLTAGLLAGLGLLTELLLQAPWYVPLASYAGAYATAGWKPAHHGYHALRNLEFDIDVLMVTAALGAAALGHWREGALLLFLFSLGHALEHRALDKARHAIQDLQELAPETARLISDDGDETEVRVEDLQRGDHVVVRPGERIPADADILHGTSTVNQAPITGESVPLEKEPGDEVFAGTVNGHASLTLQITRLAQESTLQRIIQEVEEAQTRKSTTQRFSERFERTLTPAVLALTALVMTVPALIAWTAPHPGTLAWLDVLALPWQESVLRGLVILVAASPCALALATPASILAGVARSARGGVLFKGGAHVEALSEIDAVAFDKTGTVTEGEPQVVQVEPFGATDRDEVLSVASRVEARSEHPLARAIVAAAQKEDLAADPVRTAEARTGLGVVADTDDGTLRVGRMRLFEEEGLHVPDLVADAFDAMPRHTTPVLVHDGARFLGVIAIADEPRAEAKEALRELRRSVEGPFVLLTGDRQDVAEHVAERVGFDEVHAELLPGEKVEQVEMLRAEHGGVAMVGDGVNDAPAMARASVGVAMGASGTDVALETADVALMGDRLDRLPFAFETARRTERIVVENLFVSLAVILVLVPLAALGLAGFVPAILAHEGSTLLVVGNALRLLR